ncbi:hypothetical protein [uncultured Clostridium sp.]|uniref:hypothetical protein n=1 Tax=uncultured Clostridium sp. TaxID=59620 RepID=UPI0032177540
MSKVSNSLMVRCFMENAGLEGKKVIMSYENTYKVEVNKYNVNKNVLEINGEKIDIGNVYESRDGYYMKIGEWELVYHI